MALMDAAFFLAVMTLCGVCVWGLLRGLIPLLRRHNIVDTPDARRRGHDITPRGGGLAFVVVWAVAALAAYPNLQTAGLVATATVVALVGFADDMRGLPALLRLTVHAVAAIVVTLLAGVDGLWLLPALIMVAGFINAFNFMDGSNGLAASQALFMSLAMGGFAGFTGRPEDAYLPLVLAGCVAGFLPLNFPRAAVFMGDAGSTFLGLVLAAMLLPGSTVPAAVALCLPALFLVDAGLTLAFRIVTGQRWYTAHREHAYQRMIDAGFGQQRVCLIYWAANLGVVLPAAMGALYQPWAAAIPYGLLGAGWCAVQWVTRHE